MVKLVGPRLRDPAPRLPLAMRASSRNLEPSFLTIPVQGAAAAATPENTLFNQK